MAMKWICHLDDRLREMTRFGERQLSVERSQLFKMFTFCPDDRLGPEARVDATTASSAYGRLQSASTSDPVTVTVSATFESLGTQVKQQIRVDSDHP